MAGVTAIELSTGAMTVRAVEPLTEPEVAVMVVVPSAALDARPVLLMGATVAIEEVQAAVLLRSLVVPSLYVPVALNCWVAPRGIEALPGATAMLSSAAGVTVRVVDPLIEPEVAVTVVAPTPTVVASPWLPLASLTVATAASVDVQ